MSPVNNSNYNLMKSAANKSLDDCPEYDLDSWLHYAVEDPLDKGYCPDFFGYWSSPPCLPQVHHVAVGEMGSTENHGFLNKPEASRTLHSIAKERTGAALGSISSEVVSSSLLKAKNAATIETLATRGAESRATGGFAIRADRAAGTVLSQNRDTFRTTARASVMNQSFSGSQGSSVPVESANSGASLESPAMMSHSNFRIPSSKTLENPTMSKSTAGPNRKHLQSVVDELQYQQQRPHAQPMAGLRLQVSNAIAMGMRTTQPNTMPCSSASKYVHATLSQPQTQLASNPQESGFSHVTDMLKMSDNTSCGSNPWDILQQRVTSASTDRGLEMEPSSSLQDLQVGTTSSMRDVLCTSKRKKEDECPSEDAEGESTETGHLPKFSSSKRNRAAEVHNLSERNRRNRINEKLKALQDLIPNSSKTDKASILDEAIEYLKTLQMQLQMVSMRSGMAVSPMMIPVGMPHLQMAPIPSVGIGVPIGHASMGIGMGMGLHMSTGMGMNMVMPQVAMNPSSHQSAPITIIHSRPASHNRVLNSESDDGKVPTISDFNPSEHMQTLSQIEQFKFTQPGSYAAFDTSTSHQHLQP